MTLTKGKNNTHKQRTLPNDERPFKGSNRLETDINGCRKMTFVPHIGLCGTRVTGPLCDNNSVDTLLLNNLQQITITFRVVNIHVHVLSLF